MSCGVVGVWNVEGGMDVGFWRFGLREREKVEVNTREGEISNLPSHFFCFDHLYPPFRSPYNLSP